MSNDTTENFDRLQADYDAAEADTGPAFPDPGVYDCALLGLHVGEGSFTEQNTDGKPVHQCTVTQFEYEVLNDPSRKDTYRFRGSMGRFCPVAEVVGDGYKQMVQLALGRLKASVAIILGRDPGNLADDIRAVQDLIAGENEVTVRVRVSKNKRGYTEERILELIG